MQKNSPIRKGLPIIIVVLFLGISIAAPVEASNKLSTKTNVTVGLRGSPRDEIEIKYYDPNTLSSVLGVCGPKPEYWKEAIRLTQTELSPYSTWNLTKVVIGFGEDYTEGPMNVTIFIYDMGNATHPGVLIVNDTKAILNGTRLITVPLVTPVSLTGHTELWVAVEWVQRIDSTHYAFVDAGPAVDGKGDWSYVNNVWSELQRWSIDSNWALGAIVEGPNLASLTLGNIKGPLGITTELKNIGNVSAHNILWNISVKGGFLGKVNKIMNGDFLVLVPGQTINLSMPPFLGFGTINIDIKAYAENAEEIRSDKSAFLVGIFVIWIR